MTQETDTRRACVLTLAHKEPLFRPFPSECLRIRGSRCASSQAAMFDFLLPASERRSTMAGPSSARLITLPAQVPRRRLLCRPTQPMPPSCQHECVTTAKKTTSESEKINPCTATDKRISIGVRCKWNRLSGSDLQSARTRVRPLHMLRPILRRLPLPIKLIISTQKELLNLRGPPVGVSAWRQVSRLAEQLRKLWIARS